MLGGLLLHLHVMCVLGLTLGDGQEVACQVPSVNAAPEAAGSISLKDVTFFSPPIEIPPEPFLPVPQLEESEPGNFLLGALVGAVVTAVALHSYSSQGDGGAGFPFLPLGAVLGGIIFWSAGIG